MNLKILCLFQFLAMFITIVGAGAASCYRSGSDQMMRLLAAPAPQHSEVPNRAGSEVYL
jgi:hypothetical protein